MKVFIRAYFLIISMLSSKMAGRLAFRLFQTTRRSKIKKREELFYGSAHHFRIPYHLEDISCYEMGDPQGKTVLLVHGWDSHAGSMGGIAMDLATKGYHVLAFNLPAHGNSKLKRANLKICREVFLTVLEYINSSKPISIIAHSFGSAVTAYSLASTRFSVDKLIFLTNPNKLSVIFSEFSRFIGLSTKGYEQMLQITRNLLGEPAEKISIEDYGDRVKYKQLLLIHDYYDKVLPYQNSVDVRSKWDNAKMITYHNIGHYRMLWNEDLIQNVSDFLSANVVQMDEHKRINSMAS